MSEKKLFSALQGATFFIFVQASSFISAIIH
ncbi:hypothetical protein EV194_1123 [Natronoflexus pectinivorans]|uniref:Uncharacterized protein n=1 Tax=Natronoflexus pectinivorans TaxID=682526 RepID=A0A4R2GG74_9BACT|nr:hypothetical protein EV194_1123 [Natronoflexus pectinivorans]